METRSRSFKAVSNMAAAMAYYVLNIVLSLINRKYLVYILGIEYQGADGLFSSVLYMLGLAEMGIGTIIVYHLYKPLAEKDHALITDIMRFYRHCFIIIAAVISTVGVLLSFRIDFFVGETTLDINLKYIYLLMLAETVASYFFSYKRSILFADQKNYIESFLNIVFVLGCNLSQIAVLYFFRNYYLYLFCKLIWRLLESGMINIAVNKRYPFLREKQTSKLDAQIRSDIARKIKGLLCHKIGAVIVNGTDNILISKFVGLAAVGIYSNYNYMISAASGILNQIFTAVTGSVGNLLVECGKEKRESVFRELDLVNLFLSSLLGFAILVTSDDIVALIFGDEYILPKRILFVIIFNMLLNNLRRLWRIVKSSAGIQYEDRWVAIYEAVINLIASLAAVHYWGFIGVFIGTLFTHIGVFVYTFPVLVYQNVLGGNLRNYCLIVIGDVFYFFWVGTIVFLLCAGIQSRLLLLTILLKAFCCLIVHTVFFVLIYGRTKAFRQLKQRLLRIGREGL